MSEDYDVTAYVKASAALHRRRACARPGTNSVITGSLGAFVADPSCPLQDPRDQ